jgi:trigger factor
MTAHTHDFDVKSTFTCEPLPGSQVKISGEIPLREIEKERGAAVAVLGAKVQIDGFRPGHIPESILVSRLGEMTLFTEMAERAIAHIYHHLLQDFALDAIGQPKIELTKVAPGNPVGITITVAVIPTITLPDYQALAKAKNQEKTSPVVTDVDLEDQIKDILRRKAAFDRLQQKAAAQAAAEAGDLPTPETVEPATESETDFPIPELTDDVARSLGQPGQFSDVSDFKAKLREHLTIEKTREVAAAHRAAITDAIIEGSSLELPEVLIDSELSQMFGQMEEDLTRANLKLDDYLNHIKKSKEDLMKDWTPAAEKRAKLQLILNEIAKRENITPDANELKEQVAGLMERYKDADERRVALYVASVLTNEAVMKYLEALT